MRNLFYALIMVLIIGCVTIDPFKKSFDKIYTCDTILMSGFPPRVIKIYESYKNKEVVIDKKKYKLYKINTNQNEDYGYILFKNSKIEYLPSDYKQYDEESCLSKPQLIFDFDFKVGEEWEVCYAGIFSNSRLKLDSINCNKSTGDSIFYISANRILKISDQVNLQNFTVSKKEGFINFIVKDGVGFGNIVNCNCKN